MLMAKKSTLPFDLKDDTSVADFVSSWLQDISPSEPVMAKHIIVPYWQSTTNAEHIEFGKVLSRLVDSKKVPLKVLDKNASNHKRYIVT
ncbi:MAG: hypothetical protein COA63_009785 [Methylophaga sp.]|nr:hypothetical protein [Methylophaga sp.]